MPAPLWEDARQYLRDHPEIPMNAETLNWAMERLQATPGLRPSYRMQGAGVEDQIAQAMGAGTQNVAPVARRSPAPTQNYSPQPNPAGAPVNNLSAVPTMKPSYDTPVAKPSNQGAPVAAPSMGNPAMAGEVGNAGAASDGSIWDMITSLFSGSGPTVNETVPPPGPRDPALIQQLIDAAAGGAVGGGNGGRAVQGLGGGGPSSMVSPMGPGLQGGNFPPPAAMRSTGPGVTQGKPYSSTPDVINQPGPMGPAKQVTAPPKAITAPKPTSKATSPKKPAPKSGKDDIADNMMGNKKAPPKSTKKPTPKPKKGS